MRTALETHNRVLREAVAAHDGTVFSYTGDGMCAVFTSPRAAVDAAVAAQRMLELPVRMGIGTGEAALRGDDYFGTVLNRTARVMAAGHGGQILIDGATGGLLSGVDLIPLGSRRLRDIAKPVDVFQVQADGLRTEFPPLKTEDPRPGNLRPRNDELSSAERPNSPSWLSYSRRTGWSRSPVSAGSARHGSRSRSPRAWIRNFPDGVWVIELAAVGDAGRGARCCRGGTGHHPNNPV